MALLGSQIVRNRLDRDALAGALKVAGVPDFQKQASNLFRYGTTVVHEVSLLELNDMPDVWFRVFEVAFANETNHPNLHHYEPTGEHWRKLRPALEELLASNITIAPRGKQLMEALHRLANPVHGERTVVSSLAEAYQKASLGFPEAGPILRELLATAKNY